MTVCASSTGFAQTLAEPLAQEPTVVSQLAVPPPADNDQAQEASATPADPWEGFNRRTFKLNRGLDRYVFGPIGRGYMKITSKGVRNRVSSVVTNLGEPGTAINDLAQGRPRAAGVTTSRFLINSTVGGLGLFDVGAKLGLEGHRSDFGQTLGRYGAESGRYVVLPLLGPTTLRDGAGRLVDTMADPVAMATAGASNFGMIRGGVTSVDARANADGFIRALDDAADPYAMMRSAYLQNRADVVRQAKGGVQVLPDFDAARIEP
ncbi:MlaA family lipoprotein [Caulobacter radicis]|uniref:MlaA family lipoprotein n=1 Tax=Caulobacter radicis TaxID=2172650 RepID=UPI001FCC63C5|nr:VacJ family lipoprotein [Caulobacter radicis]